MVLVEPVAAATDSVENVESAGSEDSVPAHEATPSPNLSATAADFEDAARLFDEPSGESVPGSPDLTETVEDLSVQAERSPETSEENVDSEDASGWKDEPAETNELDDVTAPELSPPPRPVSDDVLLPNADWTSASTIQWRNRVLTGIAAFVGVVLALMLLVVFSGGDQSSTIGSGPAAVETASTGETVSDRSGPRQSADPAVDATADSDPASPLTEDDSSVASSDATSVEAVADVAAEPPIESMNEPPVPDAASSEPESSDVQPVANEPRTDEPPGLTPKEATTDARPADGEPSPLSDTLREFGEFLEKAEEPVSPTPPVATELPAESDESEDEPVARRTGPRVVALDERLNDPVAQIEFDGVPLANFLRFVSDYSTIPITLDADILRWARVSPITAVKLKAADTTVAEMLKQGLAPLGLEILIESDQLFVTRRPTDETGMRTVTFKVEDLVGDDAKQLQQLGTRIMDFAAPESWSSRGGIGTITFRGTELLIEQHETVQFEVLEFCEKLRVARGLKPRSRAYDPAMFRLETRGERAREKLAQPITLTYIRPASLQRIVDRIAQTLSTPESKLHILIDWRALAEAGWSPDANVRFSVADQPLTQALATLLEPMDLAYRVIDESTLQITTPAVLDSRLEFEFYRVPKVDDDGTKLVQSARDALGPTNFRDFGGGGQLVFDKPSNCLLACLSQSSQMELQAWLTARSGSAEGTAAVETTTPTATVESRIVPTSGRVSND